MNCMDREQIFLDGTAAEWAALDLHAATCAECAEELRAWKALGSAAGKLRDYRENPDLWPRIAVSLIAQQGGKQACWWESLLFWRRVPLGWQLVLAGVMVLVMALTGGYLFLYRNGGTEQAANGKFLKDHKLAELERTEREYRRAIDQLAIEARPQLEANSSPLLASYQEKLMLLDSAIDELRREAGQNPSNAHLRYQLLAMYQAKEATLLEILETK